MVASGLLRHATVDQALGWLRAAGARRLVIDSREVRQGDAFVAWPGAAHDARQFVHQALAAGACACIVAEEGVEPFGFDDERVAALPRLKQQLSMLCSAFYGHPSAAMDVMAVTGTNGKTSTAWWWAQASALLGERCAVVGTLGIGEPPTTVGPSGSAAAAVAAITTWTATGLTTPDPATLQGGLAAFVRQGVRRCAIEASSIGLVEHRLDALNIRIALFTNFTQDHLDYHRTLEHYWSAKRQLFDWPTLEAAVINVDEAHGARLHAELKAQRPMLNLWSVGQSEAARLRVRRIQSTALGTRFELEEKGSAARAVEVPFIGSYNVHNLLGVLAGLRALGHSLDELLAVLPRLSPVPGRLQAQGGAGEPLVVVDYAHTPDALDKALSALQPVARARGGRLWCVFGCGGDRDRSKRPLMGKVAQDRADEVVLTADNPRTEDPQGILADVFSGMSSAGPGIRQVSDRRSAILQTLQEAGTRDVVLVAGKGHEDYQEVGGVRHPFSDAQCVTEGLKARVAQGFMTLADMATGLGQGATLLGDPRLVIRRVHTDTRSLQAGDLYVALRGERFDGHDFLAEARERGAVAALAEGGLDEAGLPGVQVRDSLKGLQSLARAWRAQLDLPVIAVTGSNGKTTVTQMAASILRAWKGDRAAFTRGNLNNHIGVPLSVLSLRAGAAAGHEAAVLELGMNHPGEVQVLAAIAQPTVAVVNNAQREHQEFMHTVQAVAEENGAVLQALPPNGTAVFPADDAFAGLWARMAGAARVWRFSFEVLATPTPQGVSAGTAGERGPSSRAEVHGRATWVDLHWAIEIDSPVGSLQTTLHMPGRHNVHNAMAAACAALAAGAPLWAVAQGLRDFQAVAGRSRLLRLERLDRPGHPLTLIDDTYNANPDSVRAAIEVLAELPGPRALILGDMGEVGEQGPAFHAEVGDFARQRGLEHCWTLGTLCAHAAAAYGHGARHFDSMDQLNAALGDLAQARSLLVKGSRFMRMERVVSAVQAQTREAG